MSALRKKIAEKKKAETERSSASSTAAPPPAPAPKATVSGADAGGFKQGFLSGHDELYPVGSAEAAPALWRSGTSKAAFELSSTPTAYEICARFKEAGRFLGKEDFEVSRQGLVLRVRGSGADPQSLVAGLDESLHLPPDADWEGMAAEFVDCALRIRIPRLTDGPLAELVSTLSLEQAVAIGAQLEAHASEGEVSSAPSPS